MWHSCWTQAQPAATVMTATQCVREWHQQQSDATQAPTGWTCCSSHQLRVCNPPSHRVADSDRVCASPATGSTAAITAAAPTLKLLRCSSHKPISSRKHSRSTAEAYDGCFITAQLQFETQPLRPAVAILYLNKQFPQCRDGCCSRPEYNMTISLLTTASS
jgi:hypothetical protein